MTRKNTHRNWPTMPLSALGWFALVLVDVAIGAHVILGAVATAALALHVIVVWALIPAMPADLRGEVVPVINSVFAFWFPLVKAATVYVIVFWFGELWFMGRQRRLALTR